MNSLDVILIILILLPALFGFKKGIIKTIFSYAGLLLGLILAVKFNSGFSLVLKNIIKDAKTVQIISFLFVLLFVYFIFVFIASKISKSNFLSKAIDKTGGLILGFLKGILFSSLMLILLHSFSLIPVKLKDNSLLFPYVSTAAPVSYNFIKDIIPFSKKDFNDVLIFMTSDTTKTK